MDGKVAPVLIDLTVYMLNIGRHLIKDDGLN
ncbi:unnamed protein product, partial [Acanthocheilonema viteae]